MAPVATNDTLQDQVSTGPIKNGAAAVKLFNPFYSPTNGAEGDDGDYKYAKYKVRPCPIPVRRVDGASTFYSSPRSPSLLRFIRCSDL